jgi:hypothetical protein
MAHGAGKGGGPILHTHLDAAGLLVLLIVGSLVLVVVLFRDGIWLRREDLELCLSVYDRSGDGDALVLSLDVLRVSYGLRGVVEYSPHGLAVLAPRRRRDLGVRIWEGERIGDGRHGGLNDFVSSISRFGGIGDTSRCGVVMGRL